MAGTSGYLTVGRWGGAPVRVHWTLPLGAFVLGEFRIVPGFWLGFFLIVLIHETGHAIVVLRHKYRVVSIDIHAGGGLALDGGAWVPAPQQFLFPVHVLGALFRGKFLSGLARMRARGLLRDHLDDRAASRRRARLYKQSWVVYAKRPFGGAEQVYRYYAESPIMLSWMLPPPA